MDGLQNLKENITNFSDRLVLSPVKQNDKKFSSSTPKQKVLKTPYIPPHRRNNNFGDNSGALSPQTKPKSKTSTKSIPTFDNISVIRENEAKNNDAKVNKNQIIQRILELANNYINETFKEIANKVYQEKYNECLPGEILNSIKFSVMEEMDQQFHKTDNKTSNINHNGLSYKPSNQPKPEKLNFANINKEFWLNVYSCQSVSEIYGAIIDGDHFDKVEELAVEMESFYSPPIEKGLFYAVLDGSWHRVQCLECHDSTATVLFIDRGDQDEISKKLLYPLDEKFCLLPAQAIKMSLTGLDIFSDCDDVHKILNNVLPEKNIFVKINSEIQNKSNCLAVQLYLQNDEEIMNIDDLVINQIFETVLNPNSYIELDKFIEVKVSHVDGRGSVFIKLISKSSLYFEKVIQEFTKKYISNENFKRQMVIRFDVNKTYLVRNSEDGNWYRARILQFMNEYEIQVLLIDIGSVATIKREDFVLIEKLCNILSKYPKQAIEAQLDQVSRTSYPKLLNQLQQVTCNKEALYVKFIKLESDNKKLPVIKLFRKNQNGSLICINDVLNYEQKLFIKTNTVEYSTVESSVETRKRDSDSDDDTFLMELKERLRIDERKKMESLFEHYNKKFYLSSLLKSPNVPEDNYFDVHVVIANNPSCFVIQLLRDRSLEFVTMVCELTKICNCYEGPKLTHESIQVGQLYAIKCEDQQWYRIYVTKIVDTKFAKGYFCDYGNHTNVNIENLIPLKNEFYKLPYQAIWAELYGIEPINNEWTVKDSFWFKDLILSRNFVCRVRNKREVKPEDKVLRMVVETIYEVELIDTSTDEDIYLADILIKTGRAVLKSNITFDLFKSFFKDNE